MSNAVFYHAGCSVCINAEQKLFELVDNSKSNVEVVHIGIDKSRIAEAELLGVKSVPALVIDNNVLHINFGASIEDVKKA